MDRIIKSYCTSYITRSTPNGKQAKGSSPGNPKLLENHGIPRSDRHSTGKFREQKAN